MVMKKCCGVLRIAVGIMMLGLLLAGSANAVTLTVCPSGCSYSSIQKAINTSSNGDTILVKSGTYFENVNVTKQLTLRGIGNPVVNGDWGIAITLAEDGITLEGFTATGTIYCCGNQGIVVISNNNTMKGNNASNNWNGINMEYSSNNTLIGNNVNGNNNIGISLSFSNNNTLINNNASNNAYSGISLSSSSNNTLSGNMMTGNQYNFNLYGDTDADFENHIERDNLVGGKPIYYIIKASDETYDSSSNAGTFYCISCVNVTIKNLTLNKNGKGIYFRNTSQSRILNVKTSNNGGGISLSDSNNNTLSNNKASNNGGGISLSHSSNNTLIGNNAINNWNGGGIYLRYSNKNMLIGNAANSNRLGSGISLSHSSNNTLTGNTANSNFYGRGIVLSKSNNNALIGNTANSNYGEDDNYGDGISLYSSSNNMLSDNNASNNYDGDGISLYSSSNNTLSGNNANSNKIYDGYYGGAGISLSSSSNNSLTGNIASNNEGKGIYLWSSSNNKIYNNIFNNTNNFDFHKNKINTWNTKKQSGTNIIGGLILGGNFWANPDGTGFSQTCQDLNNNGICEKRYILNENNIDYLPLSMNFTMDIRPPKSVSKLKNATYAKNFINWTWKDPKDIDFKKVMVFIDGQFKKNVSKGKMYYNATNFNANTRHTISTWTVDMNGNINKTWANHSAWTAK